MECKFCGAALSREMEVCPHCKKAVPAEPDQAIAATRAALPRKADSGASILYLFMGFTALLSIACAFIQSSYYWDIFGQQGVITGQFAELLTKTRLWNILAPPLLGCAVILLLKIRGKINARQLNIKSFFMALVLLMANYVQLMGVAFINYYMGLPAAQTAASAFSIANIYALNGLWLWFLIISYLLIQSNRSASFKRFKLIVPLVLFVGSVALVLAAPTIVTNTLAGAIPGTDVLAMLRIYCLFLWLCRIAMLIFVVMAALDKQQLAISILFAVTVVAANAIFYFIILAFLHLNIISSALVEVLGYIVTAIVLLIYKKRQNIQRPPSTEETPLPE